MTEDALASVVTTVVQVAGEADTGVIRVTPRASHAPAATPLHAAPGPGVFAATSVSTPGAVAAIGPLGVSDAGSPPRAVSGTHPPTGMPLPLAPRPATPVVGPATGIATVGPPTGAGQVPGNLSGNDGYPGPGAAGVAARVDQDVPAGPVFDLSASPD